MEQCVDLHRPTKTNIHIDLLIISAYIRQYTSYYTFVVVCNSVQVYIIWCIQYICILSIHKGYCVPIIRVSHIQVFSTIERPCKITLQRSQQYTHILIKGCAGGEIVCVVVYIYDCISMCTKMYTQILHTITLWVSLRTKYTHADTHVYKQTHKEGSIAFE